MSTGEAKLSSAASSAIKPPTCPPRALLTPVRACQDTHGVGRPGTCCNHHHTLLFTCKGAETRTPMFTGTQTLTPGPNCSWAHPLSRLGHPGHTASCSAILPARSPPGQHQVLLQSRLSYLLLQAVSLASLQPLSYLFPARMITGIQVLLLCVCLPCHRVDLWEEGSWLILAHHLQSLSRALAPNEDGAAFPKSLALTSYTPELCLHGTQSSVKETKRQ